MLLIRNNESVNFLHILLYLAQFTIHTSGTIVALEQ